MTRNRILVATAALLVLAGYALGPGLLAPQSDRAATRCADQVRSETSSVSWRVFPAAGWVCADDEGRETYLGWWA